jgi:N-acetylglucosamine-6-sulfatase
MGAEEMSGPRHRWIRWVVVASVSLASGSSLITSEVDAAAPDALTLDHPNIVVILTDDQRWDQLQAMTTLKNELQAKGHSFTNAFAVDPLCCPSRVALLRGQYPHSTRIYRNSGSLGGATGFLKNGGEQVTLATMLDGAGYRTALVGKYLNGYTTSSFTRVPPGWDEWRAFSTSGAVPYFNYPMSVNGRTVSYGSDPEDYATDVLAGYADEFIRTTPIDEPLFLYLSTGAPHAPMTPPPRYTTSAACTGRQLPPGVGELDVTDKPSYIAERGWTSSQQKQASQKWVKSCKTLLAVDDAVGTVLTALEDTGRLGDTLIVYVSDNGYLFGEHRYFGKKVPYDESIRLPMVVRYDPLTGGAGVSDDRLVINIDITATALELAGVVAPYQLGGSRSSRPSPATHPPTATRSWSSTTIRRRSRIPFPRTARSGPLSTPTSGTTRTSNRWRKSCTTYRPIRSSWTI